MYRRILVPVDGSDASMTGLAHAVGLAADQNARLRILNVVDDLIMTTMMSEPGGGVDLDRILDTVRADGRKTLDEAEAYARKAGARAETAQVESRGRTVSEVILADAKRWKSDVIVMGTHGRRGFNRLLLGSDAERVLRDAPVPVLLTRQGGAKRGGSRRSVAKRKAR